MLASGVCLYRFSDNMTFCLTTTADLEVPGRIQDAPGYTGQPVYKRGAATLILSGTNTFAGRFTVVEGTVELASDTALPPSAPITLKNCSVTCGAGTTNTTGVLTLSGNTTIALGEGAALAFADSSGETWADGATLTVTGTEPLPTRALRFGTDGTGLGEAQLKRIRYNGSKVSLTAEGYLGEPKGMKIVIR